MGHLESTDSANLILHERLPIDRPPVAVYLVSLRAEGSRRVQASALKSITKLLDMDFGDGSVGFLLPSALLGPVLIPLPSVCVPFSSTGACYQASKDVVMFNIPCWVLFLDLDQMPRRGLISERTSLLILSSWLVTNIYELTRWSAKTFCKAWDTITPLYFQWFWELEFSQPIY